VIDSEYQPELFETTPTFPWPPREGSSFLDALGETWKASVFSPTSFFRRMPRRTDFGWAVGYYLIVSVVAGGVSLFWYMLLGDPFIYRFLPESSAPANPIIDFLLSPIVVLIALFILAGVTHACLAILGGAKHGFQTTARVMCFASSAQLFNVIPFVGTIIGGVWGLVVTVIGLREAHQTTTGKAVGALLLPFLLLMALGVLAVVAGLIMGLAV
jgi:hypothetical protein